MSGGRVAVTVDVEFFDSAFLFRNRAPDQIPEETRTMGMEGIEFIADLLERYGVHGTFFTLGEVGEQIPGKIAELVDRGHEIASHGYSKSHPDLRKSSKKTVREELASSKRVLENTIGEKVDGFRAPAFALNDDVLEIAAELGYAYDSSVVPCRRIPGFYGTPDAPSDPFSSESWFSTPGMTEFPMATSPFFQLPVSGAWMRLLGRRYALWGVRNHMKRHPTTVLYVHPWELVDVPQYDAIPKRVTWRTGQYTQKTLSALVSEHASRMGTMRSLYEKIQITSREGNI